MAQLIELNFNPERKTLRQFGFIALAAFGLLAVCAHYEAWMFGFGLGSAKTLVSGILAGLAGYALLAALLFPAANRPLYVGLSIVAYPIGFVLSYVIMGTLFFGLFAPVGILFRVLGRDPMHRELEADKKSYWSEARPARPKPSYFRQF